MVMEVVEVPLKVGADSTVMVLSILEALVMAAMRVGVEGTMGEAVGMEEEGGHHTLLICAISLIRRVKETRVSVTVDILFI